MNVLDAVDAVMCRPWEWGQVDCITAAASVFDMVWGVDPAARVRGTYDSARQAMAKCRTAGGFLELAEREFIAAGLVRGSGIGAIGLAQNGLPTFGGLAVVICVHPGMWAGKNEKGYAVISQDVEGWVWRF